jgi:hypothetical protein
MSARDVDDEEDRAKETAGFFGGGATGTATVRSGALGAGCAGWVSAECWGDGVAGEVCGVTLRGIGRGFGSGTADAPCDARTAGARTAIATPSTNVRRSAALTPAEGAKNDVTANLLGESCNAARLQGYWIEYVDKTSNVLEPVLCCNTTAK